MRQHQPEATNGQSATLQSLTESTKRKPKEPGWNLSGAANKMSTFLRETNFSSKRRMSIADRMLLVLKHFNPECHMHKTPLPETKLTCHKENDPAMHILRFSVIRTKDFSLDTFTIKFDCNVPSKQNLSCKEAECKQVPWSAEANLLCSVCLQKGRIEVLKQNMSTGPTSQ